MSRRVRRVGVLGHTERPGVRRAAKRLAARLPALGCEVRLDEDVGREMGRQGYPLPALARWCEVLISLGGDGTALRGARALAGRRGVLLPVNLGGLGFLAIAEEGELDAAVRAALRGAWDVAKRRLVRAVARRRGGPVRGGLAMNDAVIKGTGGYSALHLRLATLGSDLGHMVADGLIAASAAGSTAYSLSAGGPVLSHDLEALVVTPVCPHTLGSRSLVLSARDVLEIRVVGSSDHPILVLDGQETVDLAAGDEIRIGLARQAVHLFVNPKKPLARALRTKLGWQGSERRSLG